MQQILPTDQFIGLIGENFEKMFAYRWRHLWNKT
jgi:hypothetical protein